MEWPLKAMINKQKWNVLKCHISWTRLPVASFSQLGLSSDTHIIFKRLQKDTKPLEYTYLM